MFIEGEGAPEQGPWPLRASGVFLDPLEPRLEPLEPRLEHRLEARYPLRAFRGLVPISGTPSLLKKCVCGEFGWGGGLIFFFFRGRNVHQVTEFELGPNPMQRRCGRSLAPQRPEQK